MNKGREFLHFHLEGIETNVGDSKKCVSCKAKFACLRAEEFLELGLY